VETGLIGRILVAAAVVVVAMDGGSYSLEARHSLAIAVWWLVACAFVFRLGDLGGRRPAARSSLIAALGFAVVVAASVAWAPSSESAFLALDRVILYIGIGALAALTPRRALAVWCDGFALGVTAVALLALTSRFFPWVLPAHDLPQFLPGAAERLSYPLDYWNGLAVLLAIGTPLVLRAAVAGGTAWRVLSAAAIPVLVCATYLTASRTGTAVLLLGAAVFIALSVDRWAALVTTCVVSLGGGAGILVLHARPVLVNGPFETASARAQAPTAAAMILLTCAVTGAVVLFTQNRLAALPRPPAWVGVAAAAAALGTGVLLVGMSHPRARLAAFAEPPSRAALAQPDFVQSHLLSIGGGGRWQFWRAAAAEFEHHPLLGGGGGSYEPWWAQHGSLPIFVRYAHSLYLETLGEFGLIGVVLLVVALICPLYAGITALASAGGSERTTVAALIAAAIGYLVAAGVDWMWQLAAVSMVGIACLGLLTAAGSRAGPPTRRGPRRVLRLAAVTAALLAIACEGLPLLTDTEIRASQASAGDGDGNRAVAHARAAAKLEPWAASPYVQLALVYEQNHDLGSAARAIHAALRRDDRDWRSWLIAARIETKRGLIRPAGRSLKRAETLNPRSPIFGTPSAATARR